jgi:hypothetical protein
MTAFLLFYYCPYFSTNMPLFRIKNRRIRSRMPNT